MPRDLAKISFILDICQAQGIQGYPTFKFYQNGQSVRPYQGGRTKADFISELESFAASASVKTEL